MTSDHREAVLHDALSLIVAVADLLNESDYAAIGWAGIELHDRVRDFMVQHAEELRRSGLT